jgi:Glyoxalase-like domain
VNALAASRTSRRRISVTLACRIDHLVLACAGLEQGAQYVRARLGVDVQPGGRHVLMGTHNALLRLGPRTYLELIALDPEGAAQRPRWFALDSLAVRERMAQGPFLLTWVAACSSVEAAAALDGGFGEVIAASRGAFSWRITVPADGSLPGDGVVPTLIQWDGDAHPCDGLAERGCVLREVELSHPRAPEMRRLFDQLGLGASVRLQAGASSITARITTPCGVFDLR